MEEKLHPELRKMFSVMPKMNFDRENLADVRIQSNEMLVSIPNDAVLTTERFIPGPEGEPDVRVKIYEPKVKDEILPGVFYIHGGGYIVGSPELEEARCQELVTDVNCVIVSVDYRLAPEHPFPAPVEDCYAALNWFSENAEGQGVDPSRIAVVGASAGGGLTAAVSLLARDRKGPSIAFQMPLYPMIDDRHITPSSNEITDDRVWNTKFNRQGWEMYLGNNKGEVSPYAAPARSTDLSGLPPTYTCVGDLDPFRDETIDYVARLRQAGVPVEFHLYPGCFHGFEFAVPTAEISQRAKNEYNSALKHALHQPQFSETV
ncbi:alpha/beta hydrolase [Virgibacillus sp. 179-BFC.A HS]|uniref:Alpha/beta hydrolase n=1 Tax=Tigheibacillus jepli TaxID=3035914 RepID=A0ABU5CKS6_9BACI|nr:alpha/beta hydrolase [Virgibacillus sp. 179-BFC.A HS]MDY0406920.1 alpha/beta hydrolase [Virgibacillus sp. 179-BFC.A HS]